MDPWARGRALAKQSQFRPARGLLSIPDVEARVRALASGDRSQPGGRANRSGARPTISDSRNPAPIRPPANSPLLGTHPRAPGVLRFRSLRLSARIEANHSDP